LAQAAANWLLDTGAVVALLSRHDAAHAACVSAFESMRGKLLSTEAVVTEAVHLLSRRPGGAGVCLDFFLRSGALLVPMTPKRLERCRDLMGRYADTPMDFADASLVTLAEEFGLGRVMTLDRRGFETYRWRQTRTFVILP
jgi:predicted nucleic acid-binding protein